jgi:CRISPR/Cas system CMR subunit Cmr4 (Cas7 group RAMP superfamily)
MVASSSIKGILRDAARETIAAALPEQVPETLSDGKPRNWSRLCRKVSDDGNGKHKEVALAAGEVLEFVTGRLEDKSMLQFGGNETIGNGLCAVRRIVRQSPVPAEAKP